MVPVASGLDSLVEKPELLKGKRLALLVNHTAVTSRFEYSWDVLRKSGAEIVKIFTPEHGLFGTEQDQDPVHEQRGSDIPLVSLYGNNFNSLLPDPDDFNDIDTIVYDIQDVGSRYYTYLNTMIYAMERLHGTGIELMVLDRPNPINGIDTEGPLLQSGFESFVGVLPVPVRHGMTAGETALFARDYFSYDVKVIVVPMKGWRREMFFEDTGLPWILPSPNMPLPETALVYPGMCLLEGTSLSEGRGSTAPFQLFGAPFIDPAEMIDSLKQCAMKGFFLREHYFRPTFNKYGGSLCAGAFIHVTDRNLFRPFLFGIQLVATLKRLYEEVTFSDEVYEFNDRHPAFDLLTGSDTIRKLIEAGEEVSGDMWRPENEKFLKERKPYLLYHDS